MPTRKTAADASARKTIAAKTPAKKAIAKKPVAVKTAPNVAAPAPTAAAKPKPAAPVKSKPKLVRDSFTMPKAEYAAIEALKRRAAQLARPAKKSELLRAGVKALTAMDDKTLLATLQAVPTIKTGRPNKG